MTTNDFDTGTTLPTYHDETQGDGLLRIQWRNGEQRFQSAGRFFIPQDSIGDMVPAAPWEPSTEVFNDGTKAEGYIATQLRMAILCVRNQPFCWSAPFGTAGRYKIWQTKWNREEDNQSMQVEVLAWVEGLEQLAQPVVWTSATVKTSFAIIGRGDGILDQLDKMIVKPAQKAGGTKLDSYCFWATIAAEKDSKGKNVYATTRGQSVTKPVLVLPANPDLPWLRTQFVGTALIRDVLAPWREEFEEWRKERRSNLEEDAAPEPSHNTPQPYSPDEAPLAGQRRGEGGAPSRDLVEVKRLVEEIRAAEGDPGEVTPRKLREMSDAEYRSYVAGLRDLRDTLIHLNGDPSLPF
jgi:hypothetical protein